MKGKNERGRICLVGRVVVMEVFEHREILENDDWVRLYRPIRLALRASIDVCFFVVIVDVFCRDILLQHVESIPRIRGRRLHRMRRG